MKSKISVSEKLKRLKNFAMQVGLFVKKHALIVAAAMHGGLLVAFTLIYLSMHFTLDDEVILIKANSIVRNKLIKDRPKPNRDDFLFVNVAWEKELIEKKDKDGFPIGYEPLTNRKSLGMLLTKINRVQDSLKIFFMDINFETASESDSLLREAFKDCRKCLISYHTQNNKPKKPIFDTQLGLSDIKTDGDMVLKYSTTYNDSLKTTPLIIYEWLHQEKFEHGVLFDKLGNDFILNSFVLDMRIESDDLKKNHYNMVPIRDLLMVDDEYLAKMVKNRIVVVGDFEYMDIHETLHGKTPGPLILTNAYLALLNRDNRLTFSYLMFLFVGFGFISYRCFSANDPFKNYILKKLGKKYFADFLVSVFSYLFYFGMMSVISFFFFNIQLAILIFSFYAHFLENSITFINRKKD